MDPFGDLSPENHDQVRKYLRFFRQKREGIVREIDAEMNDLKNDRLDESMFTKEDMVDYSDLVSSAVRTHVNGDIGSVINMGALAVNQLLVKAQEKGVELALETSPLEDQSLLEAVDKMSLDAMPKNAKRGVGQLTSFRDESKMMKEEAARLEDTNSRLQNEMQTLRLRLASLERQSRDLAESKSSEADAARNRNRSLESALEEAKEENAKRVGETTQFQQMRKMMQSQAAKIRDLRQRLQRYEPDACKEDDDDA